MNEDEALAQLRDIHVPADIERMTSLDFAIWPFVALFSLMAVVLIIRLWNRRQWRRRAREELLQITETEDPSQQWSMLLALAKDLSARTGRKVTLPALAYRRPETIGDNERASFIDFVRSELTR